MSLLDSLNRFRDTIINVNEYVTLAYETDGNGNDKLSDDKKEFLVSSAFLKMFIGWEEFLEDAFLKYLLGEKSTNDTVVVRFATPVDKNHASKLLIGTQKYVDWANHEIVKRLSKLFFEDGEPFITALNSISSDLSDLKIIRNASAHISTTTQLQLDSLAVRKINSQGTNIGVADFITSISPEDTTKTILQYYQLILEITAENISNNTT